ncbi:DUF6807 domain-containing protein [Lunatibacter salilacus]|uniref:DUF6807 domain-containing protein n=1 Tax=Lunatibacter salilacus TaxID=2483804 RepID=UPI00131C2124|nr:PmoA family protein [Lunatibacter salilacus]
MKHTFFIFLLFIALQSGTSAWGQRLATLEIELKESPKFAFPVSVDLDQITHLADSSIQLMEVVQGQARSIPYQIYNQRGRKLYWMVSSTGTQGNKRVFEVHKSPSSSNLSFLAIAMDDAAIYIRREGKDLWQYNHAVAYPPAGVDSAYARSGFVHPMWSPTGKALTRIQPPDHYHHYGLWNPWTSAEFEGQTIDFWNLKERQGTVRYANTQEKIQGPVFAGYKVLHEHVVLKGNVTPKVAMVETQGTNIFATPEENGIYLADISISLNTATDDPVLLKEYRYGSLGWRTTEKWDRYNSEVITSEGKNRVEADGSLATWCIVQGDIDDDYASVVMMSSPTNYNHPEPLRIWPENQYDRGDMYANFAPTKNKDWNIEPGKNYVLNYRFLVSSKKLTAEEAESAWQNFAYPPKIKIVLD